MFSWFRLSVNNKIQVWSSTFLNNEDDPQDWRTLFKTVKIVSQLHKFEISNEHYYFIAKVFYGSASITVEETENRPAMGRNKCEF